ncbi:hypothetical protein PFLmoz3_00791 [Pseudomonas fluorescens]|uniref:Uncharacterized protein n=1 Tax=Pseudomonas fluorescens TaxID=294 RepID=A0A109LKR6_PSEFL|nr:hypothetical protein PFLmoz3_00791 [Pseudomonas fluorescens]
MAARPVVDGAAIQAQRACAQLLADCQVEAAFLPGVTVDTPALAGQFPHIERIRQVQVPGRGETIGAQRKVRSRERQVLVIGQAPALAADYAQPPNLSARVGAVEGERANRSAHRQAGLGLAIALGKRTATIGANTIAQAMLQRTLQDQRVGIADAVLLQLPQGHAVVAGTVTQQVRHHGVRHHEAAAPAVDFGDADVQVAAIPGGVQVIDDKRPRGHCGFVKGVAVLAHCHRCIAVGNASHLRRIALLRLGKHAVIGGQGDAAYTHTVEDLATAEAVADGQL